MASLRLALRQTQSILDRVDQWPVEFKQLAPCAPREDEPCQRSASGRSSPDKLGAKLGKGDRFVACDLSQTCLQCRESIGIGENLGGFLQRLVLVDRNKSRSGSAVASHEHMIASIADVVEQAAEVAAQLAHWDGLRHWPSVHDRVHSSQKALKSRWTRSGRRSAEGSGVVGRQGRPRRHLQGLADRLDPEALASSSSGYFFCRGIA